MKFFAIVAAAALCATANAASESTVHIRVHVPSDNEMGAEPVARWGQCKYRNEPSPRPCVAGNACRVRDENYGQCMKESPDEWEQCGGYNWDTKCSGSLRCVRRDGEYAQCLK